MQAQITCYTHCVMNNKTVKITKPNDRREELSSGQMSRFEGVSKLLSNAEGIHLAIATILPKQQSSPHHHVNCESAIYVLSGTGIFLSGNNLEESAEINPGDFIYIPPGAVHAPINSGETILELIVARNSDVEIVKEWSGGS